MKVKNIINIMFLIATALFTQSCSDKDTETAATGLSITKDGTEVSSLDFAMGESSLMLGVKTDANWSVSIPDADTTWLAITPHEGYGWNISDDNASNTSAYFKITAKRNMEAPRTSTLTINAGGLTKTIAINQKGITGESDGHENAWTMVDNFVLGYNMGNNLEANPYGDWFHGTKPSDWETQWGQPLITQEVINELKSKGMNVIRIPVTWYPHIPNFSNVYTKDEDYKIDAAWMARVKEVVDMVRKADMYCIINIQHDSGAKGADPNAAWLHADDDYENVTKIYQAIWKQIANEFKDYDDKLIFESFNEILNKESNWEAPADPNDVSFQTIAKLQQDFVNLMRSTGGNNYYRNLLISTYADKCSDNAVNGLQVPEDQVENHLCATFHTYDPWWFCNGSIDDVTIKPGDSDEVKKQKEEQKSYYVYYFDTPQKKEIDDLFARIDKKCSALGIPYFYGEFGACGDHPDMSERVKYADYMTKKFNEYKTAGLWWSALLNRNTLEWYESDIMDAMVKNRIKK